MAGGELDGTLGQLKLKYNKILERHNKAEEWINNKKDIDLKCREYMEYQKILKQLNQLISIANDAGYVMTHDEIVNGFREVNHETMSTMRQGF